MTTHGSKKVFQRKFPHHYQLKSADSFGDILCCVESGRVFPAIRENNMDFYCGGQRAFKKTRDKFWSNDYFLKERPEGAAGKEISFNGFPFKSLMSNCEVPLEGVLSTCAERGFAGSPEGYQLSKLFPCYSFASTERDDLQLVDVEARFASIDEKAGPRQADKIDLVFIFPKQKKLLFVEAKRRKDNRIRSSHSIPEVVEQVGRYKKQLQQRESEILEAYEQVSKDMHNVFGKSFPVPTSIVPEVPILVVGDKDDPSVLAERNRTYDTWLEPELGKSKVWMKNGVHLVDGRAIFLEPHKRMNEFAPLMNEVFEQIISSKG